MTTNVGTADRAARLVIAVVAVIGAWSLGLASIAGIALLVVAVVMAGTAAIGYCPLYRLFGISTARRARAVAPTR